MKTNWTQKLNRFFMAAGLALAAAAVMLALLFAPVQAQSGGPETGKRAAALEQGLVRLNDWHTKQEINLRHAAAAGDKLQALIDKAANAGKDVAELETALADYRAGLASAQAGHDSAAALLTAHAGFDADGKVTDALAAKQTLESARSSLQDAHVTLNKAAADLRAAVRAWRAANTTAQAQ